MHMYTGMVTSLLVSPSLCFSLSLSLLLTLGLVAATFAASENCCCANNMLNLRTNNSSAPARLFLVANLRARSGLLSWLEM